MLIIKRLINQILGLCGLEIRKISPSVPKKTQSLIRKFSDVEHFLDSTEEPILVLQMGRVGSTSVLQFLKTSGLNAYQIHSISQTGNRITGRRYLPAEFLRSQLCGIDGGKICRPMKIITMFREPISLLISRYFRLLSGRQFAGVIAKKHGMLNLESHQKPTILHCF